MVNDKNVTYMLEMNVECIYLNYMYDLDVGINHMLVNAWKMLILVWIKEESMDKCNFPKWMRSCICY